MIRAAIEIGSGTVRFCIAEMNEQGDGIKQVVHAVETSVSLAAKVKQNNNMLPEKSYVKLRNILSEFKEVAAQRQCIDIRVVTTDIFRRASNGDLFINKLSKELDLKISLVDQEAEGVMHFETVAYEIQNALDRKQLISWDSGSSSVQISTIGEQNEILVYKTAFGLTSTHILFEEQVRKGLYERKKSPNPVSKVEANQLICELKKQSGDIPEWLSQAICKNRTVVRTSGKQEHLRNVLGMKPGENSVKIETVRAMLDKVCEKSDNEIGKLINTDRPGMKRRIVLRLCMIQALMEQLNIGSIHLPILKSVGNTHGVLLQSKYWDNPK